MANYDVDLSFYGDNKAAIECQAPEVLLIGPAETGKTIALLWKLHRIAFKYSNASLVILRKTLTSTYGTVLRTFQEKVVGETGLKLCVDTYGGEKAQWFDYPNGSRIWVAGLDKSSRILSAEHDIIYVNQAEELTMDDWETLTTRTTGRAGHIPHPQTIGDANPTYPSHWMYKRETIRRFYSWHRDNPTLYDGQEWTRQGEETLRRLANLTGLRRVRLFEGKAAQAEGVVYEDWNEAIHVIEPFAIPDDWRRFRVVDFGFTNAFVCQWWAVDHDGRMYLYREIYHTKRLVEDHARQIVALSEGERVEATVCDHDAEDRATLERHGVPTIAAQKAVTVGIQAVQARLRVQKDDKPRLYVFRGALVELDPELDTEHKPTCTKDEFAGYIWEKTPDGKPNKETPHKADDHGMDAVRYGVMYLDNETQSSGETVHADPEIYRVEHKSRLWDR
jgi:phage terminase large subunit